MQAADVYLLPYRDRITSNSGTLAMAMAAGKAIVTTPFEHARFALSAGRAAFVDFDSTASIERVLGELLGDRPGMAALGAAAKAGTESLAWPRVGEQYVALLQQLAALQLAGGDEGALRAALGAGLPGSRNSTAAFFSGGSGALVADPRAYPAAELRGLAKLADLLKGNHLNKVLHSSLLGSAGGGGGGALQGGGGGGGAAKGPPLAQHLAGAAKEVEEGAAAVTGASGGLGGGMMRSLQRQAQALLGARSSRALLGAVGQGRRGLGGEEDPNAVLRDPALEVSLRLRLGLAQEEQRQ
jgi:hypothetical protein